MDKNKIDADVAAYCKKFQLSNPAPWCYPGDLIFEPESAALFLCGDNPKDVAEVRRRRQQYKKIDVEMLRKFLIESNGYK